MLLLCVMIFLINVSLSFTVGTIDVGKARLMFWDLGGQEELQSLWDKVSSHFNTKCPEGTSSPASY